MTKTPTDHAHPRFHGYRQILHEATGVTDPSTLAEIEDVMRNDIFHSTLDWQTRKQLQDAAKLAAKVLGVDA